jgi:hypothetical protein
VLPSFFNRKGHKEKKIAKGAKEITKTKNNIGLTIEA